MRLLPLQLMHLILLSMAWVLIWKLHRYTTVCCPGTSLIGPMDGFVKQLEIRTKTVLGIHQQYPNSSGGHFSVQRGIKKWLHGEGFKFGASNVREGANKTKSSKKPRFIKKNFKFPPFQTAFLQFLHFFKKSGFLKPKFCQRFLNHYAKNKVGGGSPLPPTPLADLWF